MEPPRRPRGSKLGPRGAQSQSRCASRGKKHTLPESLKNLGFSLKNLGFFESGALWRGTWRPSWRPEWRPGAPWQPKWTSKCAWAAQVGIQVRLGSPIWRPSEHWKAFGPGKLRRLWRTHCIDIYGCTKLIETVPGA